MKGGEFRDENGSFRETAPLRQETRSMTFSQLQAVQRNVQFSRLEGTSYARIKTSNKHSHVPLRCKLYVLPGFFYSNMLYLMPVFGCLWFISAYCSRERDSRAGTRIDQDLNEWFEGPFKGYLLGQTANRYPRNVPTGA